jgi:hypothetical protein
MFLWNFVIAANLKKVSIIFCNPLWQILEHYIKIGPTTCLFILYNSSCASILPFDTIQSAYVKKHRKITQESINQVNLTEVGVKKWHDRITTDMNAV